MTVGGRFISSTLRRVLNRISRNGMIAPEANSRSSVTAYWTNHNVTAHRAFESSEASIEYFHWRNAQYLRYLDLMPVRGVDGKVVLDFGCGPGNDLVGFGLYSRPARLIGADVSKTSLEQAMTRLAIHDIQADLTLLDSASPKLPFASGSVDYIHASGVLHHVPQVDETLRELRRVLRPDGAMRVMVYNYDSVWLHLYVAYIRQIAEGVDRSLSVRDAFARSTDGPNCPIADVYTAQAFCTLAEACGFTAEYLGAAISMWELHLLPRRFEAIMSEALPRQHREFLLGLAFDHAGMPLHGEFYAGVDACFLLRPR